MYIKIKVKAGQKLESLEQKNKDTFLISVKEKAERNLANKRITHLLARYFKISPTRVRIINGHHSPSKLLSINLDKD